MIDNGDINYDQHSSNGILTPFYLSPGLRPIQPAAGLAILVRTLRSLASSLPAIGALPTVLHVASPLDWNLLLQPAGRKDPFYEEVRVTSTAGLSSEKKAPSGIEITARCGITLNPRPKGKIRPVKQRGTSAGLL
jgi:hypothetical protein